MIDTAHRALIEELESAGFRVTDMRAVAGGDTARSLRVETCRGALFVKYLADPIPGLLPAEATNLDALRGVAAWKVPAVAFVGEHYLALEWLELCARGPAADRKLAHALVDAHQRSAPAHGWHGDNFIGRTQQLNPFLGDWASFFIDNRLRPQLAMVRPTNPQFPTDQTMTAAARALLGNHHPPPALLHGDLWGGNAAALTDGTPAVFDPACYFGDRETDLAMARMFGGFSQEFFASYHEAWPLPAGSEDRMRLYQLYHWLNHANLFGGGYVARASQLAQAICDRYG